MALPKEPETSSEKEAVRRPEEEQLVVEQLETPPKVEGVEPIPGATISLPQPVTDDTGAVIVDTPAPQKVTVDLPLTEDEVKRNLGQQLTESIRWLATQCKRLAKKIGGRFIYKLRK